MNDKKNIPKVKNITACKDAEKKIDVMTKRLEVFGQSIVKTQQSFFDPKTTTKRRINDNCERCSHKYKKNSNKGDLKMMNDLQQELENIRSRFKHKIDLKITETQLAIDIIKRDIAAACSGCAEKRLKILEEKITKLEKKALELQGLQP